MRIKLYFSNIFYVATGVLIIFLLVTCSKKSEIIGLELVEAEKIMVGFDTVIDIVAYSIFEDSTRTDKTTKNLLGSYYDPVFGRSTASFYTQVRLPATAPDFGSSPVVDSVTLSLAYNGFYGNIASFQTISVFEIADDMDAQAAYYSNDSLTTSVPYATMSFQPKPQDSLVIDTITYAPRLIIPLHTSFGEKILNADPADLADNTAFTSFFKGLYVSANQVATPGEGSILYFNLISDISKVTIYYNDSLSFTLIINEACARFNHFQNEYHLSEDVNFKQQVVNGDTSLGSERLFLHGMTGVSTVVFFPGLKEWITAGNVVINQARLIIPIEGSALEYDLPERISVYRIDDDGNETYTDDQYEGENYLGGFLADSDEEYFFRISLYLQRLINGTYQDNGLNIKVAGRSVFAGGTVLHGYHPATSVRRMQLKVIYSVPE